MVAETKRLLIASLTDGHSQARLLAVSSPHAGDWLHAPPLTAVGLRMSDEEVRIAVGLRLGTSLCSPHTCPCGAQVDARGCHGLSCRRSAGRQLRHKLINDIVWRALARAGVAATREPQGLIAGSPLRPDGATIIPWARGKCLAWDATTPDTVAPSHLASSSLAAGAAADSAARSKVAKYLQITATHIFVPIAVETFGPWNSEGLDLMREIGRRAAVGTGDTRETFFLLQRVSVAVQKGNAVSFAGTLAGVSDESEGTG